MRTFDIVRIKNTNQIGYIAYFENAQTAKINIDEVYITISIDELEKIND